MNTRFTLGAVSLIAMAATPGFASAVDWSVSARAETGFQYYSFKQSPMILLDVPYQLEGVQTPLTGQMALSGTELNATMPILAAGLSVVVDRFFVDASVQGSFDGSDSSDATAYGSYSLFEPEVDTVFGTYPGVYSQEAKEFVTADTDLDRMEYALSVGYAVTQSFAVYAGWKWANTSFDVVDTGKAQVTDIVSFPVSVNALGDVVGVTDFATTEFSWQGRTKYDFKQDGPFVGAAYSWSLDGPVKGALTVNAALAFLDGKIEYDSNVATLTYANGSTDTGSLIVSDFEGSTTALTLGVSWRGETGIKGLSYILGINGYSYNFDADSLNSGDYEGSDGGDITETVINFKVGIAYRF